METSTVNIAFKKDLLETIDRIAKEESRSRSELIREAARMYINKKQNWKMIYDFGESMSGKVAEEDVYLEIKKYREQNKRR